MTIAACLASTGFTLACAVPATEVTVPTMPMHQALDLARIDASALSPPPRELSRLAPATAPPGAQEPLLGVPEVRLAYLYEWIDPDGNKHFGEWVAIPVAGFNWIMNDGSRPPLEPSPAEPGFQAQGRE
jgi:hypothetical protein